MEKLTKRKLQAIETKNKIYETSIEMMKSEGFDNITMAKISKKAGVSIGSFYHYFKSKNEILLELFRRGDQYFEEIVSKNITGENSFELIIAYFEEFSKFYLLNGVDTIKALYNTQHKKFIDQNRFIVAMLRDIISDGIEKKEIKSEMSAEEITDMLFIFARGVVYNWCLHDGNYSMSDLMKRYISQIIRPLFDQDKLTY